MVHKKWCVKSLAVSVALLTAVSVVEATPIPRAVRKAVGTSKSTVVRNANIGIVVTSMQTGKVLYQRQMDHLFTPASVLKLFTATAALSFLKPTYHFQTGFYTNGKIHKDALNGDLYIKFDGDPSLTTKDLKQMAAELHNMEVHRIKGHVYIDNFGYGRVPYAKGFIWDDLSYSFAAPMNATIIDRNKFAVRFKPASQIGQPPIIEDSLPKGVVNYVNHMNTVRRAKGHCPIRIFSNNHNEYRIEGCLIKSQGAQARSLAMRDVTRYVRIKMAKLLREANVHFSGKITLKHMPNKLTPLVLHDSKSLAYLLRHMLKKSDNVYTNAIFKKLGEMYFGGTASWSKSLVAMKRILAVPTKINFKHNALADGAGLSRYNLITPNQLVKLLYYAYHNPRIRTALYDALPIAGRDGTLEARMRNLGRSGQVHAKTGSMTGVSTLAGYVETKNHGMLGFVIMVNGFVGGRAPFILMENRICEALARS